MIRKFLTVCGLCVVVLFVTGLIGLAVLHYNVAAYASYWHGRANQPGDFIYVAIGDSAGQGIGASRPENGYVGRLTARIEQTTGRTVRVINLSVTGATTADALRQQAPKLEEIQADLVTLAIGANDMKRFDKSAFASSYDQLLRTLPPGRSVVANIPYFGTRPDLNDNAILANHIVGQYARNYDLPVADLYTELRDHQSPLIYASDLFHPNNRGYQLWYDALWPAVEKQL